MRHKPTMLKWHLKPLVNKNNLYVFLNMLKKNFFTLMKIINH